MAWAAALVVHAALAMTSAYSGVAGDGRRGLAEVGLISDVLGCASLRDGSIVEISPFSSNDVHRGRELMNLIIRQGKAWPFDQEFDSIESYASYFLSHAAFVAKRQGLVVGTFYIKPNFPGRCSHVCNGGFISAPEARGLGIGTIMGLCFLKFAHQLGYRSSYFNLVFASNTVSVNLWERLGFERVAAIPKCATLRDLDYEDTAYGYYFDLTTLDPHFDPFLAFEQRGANAKPLILAAPA